MWLRSSLISRLCISSVRSASLCDVSRRQPRSSQVIKMKLFTVVSINRIAERETISLLPSLPLSFSPSLVRACSLSMTLMGCSIPHVYVWEQWIGAGAGRGGRVVILTHGVGRAVQAPALERSLQATRACTRASLLRGRGASSSWMASIMTHSCQHMNRRKHTCYRHSRGPLMAMVVVAPSVDTRDVTEGPRHHTHRWSSLYFSKCRWDSVCRYLHESVHHQRHLLYVFYLIEQCNHVCVLLRLQPELPNLDRGA